MNNMGQFPQPNNDRPLAPTAVTSTKTTVITLAATILGFLLISRSLKHLFDKVAPDMSLYLRMFIIAIPELILYVCIVVFLMKKKNILFAKGNGFGKGLLIGGFYLFVCICGILNIFVINEEGQPSHFGIPQGFSFGMEQVWCILAVALSAGVCEELMCRGIILNALREHFGRESFGGTMLAILISGVIFGCLHFVNLLAGMSLKAVLIQVVSAAGIGLYFGAVYCRCGDLKVTMFLHFLMDLIGILPESMKGGSTLTQTVDSTMADPRKLIGILIYLAVTAFILRLSKRDEMFSYDFEENYY